MFCDLSITDTCVCVSHVETQTTFLVSRGSEASGGIVSRSTFAPLLIIKRDSHKKEQEMFIGLAKQKEKMNPLF